MSTLFLSVPSIHCNHCAGTITRQLAAEPGIHTAHVDVPSRIVEVRFDPALNSAARLKYVLASAGYPVTAVSADPLLSVEACPFVPDPALPLVPPLGAGGCGCCR